MPGRARNSTTPAQLRIDTGIAGASARREYEWRQATRSARVRSRLGDRLGRVVLAVTDEPQATRSWARGAEGEEQLAEVFAGNEGIIALHDRQVAGTRGNIDHLVITPAAVYVIDAKRFEGVVRIRDRGTLLRRDERLYVGGRDRSKLADGLAWQVDAVTTALGGTDIPVTAVLCFVGSEWPLLFPPRSFRGVLLERPRTLRKRLTVAATETIDVGGVARALAQVFPPKVC